MDRKNKTTQEMKKRLSKLATFMLALFVILIVRIGAIMVTADEEDIKKTKVYGPEELSDEVRETYNERVDIYQVTDEERFWLEAITFSEAGTTEELPGQIAIAAEVLNRVQSPEFPNTIKEVMLQEGQYYDDFPQWQSPEGWRYVEKEDITDSVKEAVELALNGVDTTEIAFGKYGAFFHYAPEYTVDEGKFMIKNQLQIGNHMFYQNWDGYPTE